MPSKEFLEDYRNKKLDGIYLIVISDCVFCKMHVQNFPFKNRILVNMYDMFDEIRDELDIKDVPMTMLFCKGELLYKCQGLMYDSQLEELRNTIKTQYK